MKRQRAPTDRVFTEVAGTITIGRPHTPDSDEHPVIRLVVRMSDDADRRGLVLEVSAEDFMLALTGRTEVPAKRVDMTEVPRPQPPLDPA